MNPYVPSGEPFALKTLMAMPSHAPTLWDVSMTRESWRALIRGDRWCPPDVTDETLDHWIDAAGVQVDE